MRARTILWGAIAMSIAVAANGEYLMTRHDVLFIVLGAAPGKDGFVPAYVTQAFGGLS